MSEDNGLSIGQIVKSRAGRDKGQIFIIYELLGDNYVALVDGRRRKIDNPKKKKEKHLTIYNTVIEDLVHRKDNDIKISNSYIRKLLAPFQPESSAGRE